MDACCTVLYIRIQMLQEIPHAVPACCTHLLDNIAYLRPFVSPSRLHASSHIGPQTAAWARHGIDAAV